MKAILALENGTCFEGKAFGFSGECGGEVVFNTSMTGYQEILSDPSYNGQIVCMTYPEIGNYGIAEHDNESNALQISGFVVKNLCENPSNYRGEMTTLNDFLTENKIPGIQGIDTRMLVRILRNHGAMRGVILHGNEITQQEAVAKALAVPSMEGSDLARVVTCNQAFEWNEKAHELQPQPENTKPFKVVCIDFGVKQNTLRRLVSLGAEVKIVPARTSALEILALNPDGIYLSNGPGDPEAVTYAHETVQELVNSDVPIFGICLGHQILALAMGADTYKLKFGHRGANHPIKNLMTGAVEITAQNHGFAVSKDNFPSELEVTHINLNDATVAGLQHKSKPIFSIQYHPEASPGPHDSYYLFDKFAKNAVAYKAKKEK
jgi:carbamoyl-phosphate synthase small subunit